MTLREKLVDFRARHDLTQDELAKKIGVSRDIICGLENEKRSVWATTKRKIELYIEKESEGK